MSLKLRPVHVETLDLLHGIAGAGPAATVTSIANDIGRDESNARKTIKRMREAGLLGEGLDLTAEGRAIAQVLGPDGELKAPGNSILLRHGQVRRSPDNDRKVFEPKALDELRISILERGLLQPITITPPEGDDPAYPILFGERRWRAIALAIEDDDWPEDRLIEFKLLTDITPVEAALIRLTENVQREDLNPIEEAAGYLRLTGAPYGLGTDEVADRIGKSQRHVQNHLLLLSRLGDDDKARMALPKGDPDRLTFRKALDLVQNHKPKPAIILSPKEIVVILEIAQRAKARPSSYVLFPGHDGWVQPPKSPSGDATISLIQRDLVASAEHDTGAAVLPFARILWTPELRAWFDTYTMGNLDAALWAARCAAVTPIMAGELERTGRCATPWLNPDLPPEEPEQPSPAPPNEAGKGDHLASRQMVEGAQGHTSDPHETVSPPPAGATMLAPTETPPPVLPKPPEAALSPPLPAAKDILTDLPTLTPPQAAAMAEVCAKIAADPQDGPRGPDGTPTHTGAYAFDYYKAADAAALLAARLIGVKPDARRSGYLVCLTALGEAWAGAHGGEVAAAAKATGSAWNTPWLNPPAPAQKTPGPAGGLVGDSFSQQIRAAREEADTAETWSASIAGGAFLLNLTDGALRLVAHNLLTGAEIVTRLSRDEANSLWAELGLAIARLDGDA